MKSIAINCVSKRFRSFISKMIIVIMMLTMVLPSYEVAYSQSDFAKAVEENHRTKLQKIEKEESYKNREHSEILIKSMINDLEFENIITAYDEVEKLEKLAGYYVVTLNESQDSTSFIDKIKDKDFIELIEINNKVKSYAKSNISSLNTNGTSTPLAESDDVKAILEEKLNKTVLVGVIDTGIDIEHDNIKNSIYVNLSEIPNNGVDDDGNGFIDDVNGWDFVNDDGTVYDDPELDSHGTHIAGILTSANTNDGINDFVKILPLKFMSGDSGYTVDAIKAILYAKSMGVKIINASFGSEENNQILKDFMKDSGILFVTAAGNGMIDIDKYPIYPASFDLDNAIAVTSIGNTGELSYFSNYGNTVDIGAVGSNIISTIPKNKFGSMSGTSQSAAFTTLLASAILSKYPDMTPSQVKNIILDSARSNSKLDGKVRDNKVLDVRATLETSKLIKFESIESTELFDKASSELDEKGPLLKAQAFSIPNRIIDMAHFGQQGVSISTGNYSTSATDYSVESPGFIVKFSRSYNSKDDRTVQTMGHGWTFGFEGSITIDTSNASIYTVNLPNSSVEAFILKADGSFESYNSRNKLKKNSDGTYLLTSKDNYKYYFDKNRFMYKMEDAVGNVLHIKIADDSGRVGSIVDTSNKEYKIEYTDNRISKIILSDEGDAFIKYDYFNNQLDTVTDPMGRTTTYKYDSQGYLTDVICNGITYETIKYADTTPAGERKKVLEYTDLYGNKTSYTYNDQEKKTVLTDSNMRTITKYYDADKYVTKTEIKLSVEDIIEGKLDKYNDQYIKNNFKTLITQTEYFLDADGRNRFGDIKSIQDVYGNKTTYEIDEKGNTTKETFADGTYKSYKYDGFNNLIEETLSSGKKIFYIYDKEGKSLLKTIRPLDGVTVYSDNELKSKFSINEIVYYTEKEAEQLGYKVKGLVKTIIDPMGKTTEFTYDTRGNKSTVKDKNGNITQYEYDQFNRLTKEVSPNGLVKLYRYNYNGELTNYSEIGGTESRSKKIGYDEKGRVLFEIDFNNGISDYKMSDAQILASLDQSYFTSYEYYNSGKIKKKTLQNGAVYSYEYDLYGNMIKENMPNGSAYTYKYDGLSRLVKKSFMSDSSDPASLVVLESYDYMVDGKGNRTIKSIINNKGFGDNFLRYIFYDFETIGGIIDKSVSNKVNDRVTFNTSEVSIKANLVEQAHTKDPLGMTVSLAGYIQPSTDYNFVYEVVNSGDCKLYLSSTDFEIEGGKIEIPSELGVHMVKIKSKATLTNSKIILSSVSNTGVGSIKYKMEGLYQDNGVQIDPSGNYFYTEETKLNYYDKVISVTKNDKITKTYNYDADGMLTEETDFNGNKTYYMFDGLNQVKEIWAPVEDGLYSYMSYDYDLAGNTLAINVSKDMVKLHFRPEQSRLSTVSKEYDSNGNLMIEKSPGGSITKYEYDNMNKVISITSYMDDKKAKIQKKSYDSFGNLIEIADVVDKGVVLKAEDQVQNNNELLTKITYDKNGNIVKKTDPDGTTLLMSYNKLNKLVKTTKKEYGTLGNIIDISSKIEYDINSNPIKITDFSNNITEMDYDKRGNLIRTINYLTTNGLKEPIVTSYDYDIRNNVISTVSPENYDYTKLEIVKGTSKLDDHDSMTRSENIYDSYGNLAIKKEVIVDNSTTNEIVTSGMLYDPNGNIIKTVTGENYKAATGETFNEKLSNAYGVITKYNKANLVKSVTSPETSKSGYTYDYEMKYDGMKRLKETVFYNGAVKGTYYDENSNVSAQTIRKSYNEPEETVSKLKYDMLNNLVSSTDANGNETVYEYNVNSKLIKVTYPGDDSIEELVEEKAYDSMGRILKETKSTGLEIVYTYDIGGRLSKTISKDLKSGKEILNEFAYNSSSKMTMSKDGEGNITNYKYDELGRLVEKTILSNGNDKTEKYKYDKNSNQLSITNYLGEESTNTYDKLNRVIERRDFVGNTIEKIVYNNDHKQIVTIDSLNKAIKFKYDLNGRLTAKSNIYEYIDNVDEKSLVWEYSKYDPQNNTIESTDQLSNKTKFIYNYKGLLSDVINAKGEKTSYTYDSNNNRITQTNGNGNTTTFEYNSRSLVVALIDPNGRSYDVGEKSYKYDESKVVRYTYYADGNCSTQKDRNGKIIEFDYDGFGRKTKVDAEGEIVSYSYDNNSKVITSADEDSKIVRSYDELGRLKLKNSSDLGTTITNYSELNKDGSNYFVTEVVDVTGTTLTNTFDADGKIKEINDNGSKTTYTYRTNGQKESIIYPNGSKEVYSYDAENRLSKLTTYSTSNTVLDEYNYTYDELGNVIKKTDKKGETIYTYDELNRLKEVVEPTINSVKRSVEYDYDKAGNRVREKITKESAGTITEMLVKAYSYNEQNRLMEISVNDVVKNTSEKQVFHYDNNGNLLYSTFEFEEETSLANSKPKFGLFVSGQSYVGDSKTEKLFKSTNTYKYDNFNQLIEATSGDVVVRYSYNGKGERTEKRTKSNITEKATKYYEHGNIVSIEFDEHNIQTSRTIYGTGKSPISTMVNGSKNYMLHNGDGDVTALINQTGAVVESYYYDAFGNVLEKNNGSGAAIESGKGLNSKLYRGYQYDEEIELYFLNSRMYDPKTARFIQEDTYRGKTNDPLSLNLYTYCSNNPIRYYDPTGHWQIDDEKLSKADQEKLVKLTDDYYSATTDSEKKEIHRRADEVRKNAQKKSKGEESINLGGHASDFLKNNKTQKDSEGNAYMTAEDWKREKKETDKPTTMKNTAASMETPTNKVGGQSGPTVIEAALMAAHVYTGEGRLDGGWSLEETRIDNGSLLMRVYGRTRLDGSKEYAIVNAGTDPSSISDWINNLQQPIGQSKDLEISVSEALKFNVNHSNEQVTFIGHSKGGAEAMANALATDRDAIVFNPAMLNPSVYNLDPSRYKRNITSYVVKGEVLDTLYQSTPEMLLDKMYKPEQSSYVKKIYLKNQYSVNTFLKPLNKINSILNHMMDAVLKGVQ